MSISTRLYLLTVAAAAVAAGAAWLAGRLASGPLVAAGAAGLLLVVGLPVVRAMAKPWEAAAGAVQALSAGDLRTALAAGGPAAPLARLATAWGEALGTDRVHWEAWVADYGRLRYCETVLESLPAAVLGTDAGGTIRYLNPAGRSGLAALQGHLPCAPADLPGQPLEAVFPAERLDRHRLPLRTELDLGGEHLRLAAQALDGAGGLVCCWERITDQVRAEQRLKVLSEEQQYRSGELKAKVGSLLHVVAAAAGGDLTQEVSVRGTDGIGLLGEGIADLLADLRHRVAAIAENTEQVGAASEQLGQLSQRMRGGAENTSARAREVAGGAERVSQRVKSVAAAAQNMEASIRQIARHTTEVSQAATRAVAMAEATGRTVARLGESGARIGDVMKVITAIAEQINLLALNATIEAARAGAAGKGFTVVANEVKDLAKETAGAIEAISARIDAIQADTRGAMEAIAEIREIINQVNELQTEVARAVEQQTAATGAIGRSMAESTQDSAAIARGIGEVARFATDTAKAGAAVEEAAGELDRLASALRELIRRFEYQDDAKPLVVWDDSLSVGVEDIDRQHRMLVALINQLFRGMTRGQGREVMGEVLNALVGYTQTHFAAEEALMERHGYPDLERHREKHRALVNQVAAFQDRFGRGEAVVDEKLMEFLKAWLTQHIKGEDRRYTPYLTGALAPRTAGAGRG